MEINKELWTKAEQLAARPYVIEVIKDEMSDNFVLFVAENPELPGCMSQGETPTEAVLNLADARIDYIYFLLFRGLPVPEPSQIPGAYQLLLRV